MVGRADTVTGPYVGKDGTDLLKAGATELQKSNGRYIGPGGQEPVFGAPSDMLVYHYYDGDDRGVRPCRMTTCSVTSSVQRPTHRCGPGSHLDWR